MIIDSFAIAIENPQSLLAGGNFVAQLEGAIAKQLPGCKRLVRWAIVAVKDDRCLLEGAYLQ